MTQVYGYRHALPMGRRVDIDRVRREAIIACYRKALDDGLHPIEKPTVELDLGDGLRFDGEIMPFLQVSVRCAA